MKMIDLVALTVGALALASLIRGEPGPVAYDYQAIEAARAEVRQAPPYLTYLSRPYDRAMASRDMVE